MAVAAVYNTAKQLFGLKDVKRTGWINSCVPDPESVADHSWGTALLCLLFSDYYEVDRQRVLEISIVHDSAEVIIGDIPATTENRQSHRWTETKQRLEKTAISQLFSAPAVASLQLLCEEYEASLSKEALVVRDLNLIDMALQALLYTIAETRTAGSLQKFLDSAKERLSLPKSHAIFALIEKDFAEHASTVK